jgi:two-component system, OmpR family, response regulator
MVDVVRGGISSRILVVEDEPSINDVVSTALRYQGHSVTQASDGDRGLRLAKDTSFGLIVLDVMLPGLDGYEVCRRLREAGRFSPVLFLTARDRPADRIRGFVTGGDDYLTKPFSVDELVLRVAAILRRTGEDPTGGGLRVADLSLEPAGQEVRRGGVLVRLSPTEFRLLHYLLVNTGTVVSKDQILANVWDYDYRGGRNVVEVYIGYLRRKIDQGHPSLIHTRHGAGYVLRENRE